MAETGTRLDLIGSEAAGWVVRLADPGCTPADRAQFARWRRTSLDHEVAYQRQAGTWNRLDRLAALRPGLSDPDPDLLAAPRGRAPVRIDAAHPGPRHHATVAKTRNRLAAAAAVGLVLAASFASPLLDQRAYATGVGERRLVLLPDHNRIELNTDSRIVTQFRNGGWEVRLTQGEASFEAGPHAPPLRVVVEGRRFLVQHGALDIQLEPDRIDLVTTDSADQGPGPAAGVERTVLLAPLPGHVDAARGQVSALSSDQVSRLMAWRQDGIDLTDRTVLQAATEFNRYNTRHIVVPDPALARMRLGGYFHTTDIDGFLRALALALPVTVSRNAGGDVVLAGTITNPR